MKDKHMWIDQKIEEHKHVLMASFGFQGLLKSKLRLPLILKIIREMPGSAIENVTIFFDDLRERYLADSQFKQFRLSEVDRFISEEKSLVGLKVINN